MSLPSPAGETPPDRAGKLAAILSIQPDDSQPLTQFSADQRTAYEWAIKWLHDFNLGRRPKPGFSDEVLSRLSDFHGTQMNEYLRQPKPTVAPPLTDPEPPGPPTQDRLTLEAEDFTTDMLHNLNTHQPGVPRGQNMRNCPQPEFSPEPVGAHAPAPTDHQPVEPDPEAEWSQRVLAGMKRMTEDPEYRASIEKRIS